MSEVWRCFPDFCHGLLRSLIVKDTLQIETEDFPITDTTLRLKFFYYTRLNTPTLIRIYC